MRSQIAGRHLSGTIKPGEMMRGETVGKIIDSKTICAVMVYAARNNLL